MSVGVWVCVCAHTHTCIPYLNTLAIPSSVNWQKHTFFSYSSFRIPAHFTVSQCRLQFVAVALIISPLLIHQVGFNYQRVDSVKCIPRVCRDTVVSTLYPPPMRHADSRTLNQPCPPPPPETSWPCSGCITLPDQSVYRVLTGIPTSMLTVAQVAKFQVMDPTVSQAEFRSVPLFLRSPSEKQTVIL